MLRRGQRPSTGLSILRRGHRQHGWILTVIALLLALLFLLVTYYEVNLIDFKGKGILGVYGFFSLRR